MQVPTPWPVYAPETAARVAARVAEGEVFDYAGSGAVAELEAAMAATYRVEHALSFNSGTSAIFAALVAVGVEPGDEVVVAGWTFLAAITPLLWLGAAPVLADVREGEPVADSHTIGRALSPRTRAVLVTHLFGEPVDTAGIRAMLAHRGIALIEDCSHAHASRVGRERAGATADVAIFSLGARKIISGGHGGMLLTRDPLVYETALLVGHTKPRTRHELAGRPEAPFGELGLGGNLRMSPLAALLALDHLVRLDELGSARVRNAAVLDAAFAPFATALHSTAPGENRTHFDLVWTVGSSRERDEMVEALVRSGVPARTVATRPLSRALADLPQSGAVRGRLWRALARWGECGASLPVAEELHDRALSLPSELFHAADATYATQLASVISGVLTGGARG